MPVTPSLRAVSKAAVGYTSTSLAVPKPAGTARADILIAALLATGPFTLPEGFTALVTTGVPGGILPAGSTPQNTTFTEPRLCIAWKEATASEPSSYAFSGSAGTWLAMVAAYKDAGGVQAGSHRYNWAPYHEGDPSYGQVRTDIAYGHFFADVETLYDNCLVVGVMGTADGYPNGGGTVSLMEWLTQGLTARGSKQIISGLNPLLALFDGEQAVAGTRGGMSAAVDDGAVSTTYTFALLPRIATTVSAVVSIQQGIFTSADALFADAATPTTVDGEADFAQRVYTGNDSAFGVDGEAGSTRVTATWTRRGVLA